MLPGDVAFRLHDTYGFPIDLTVELAAEYGVRTDLAGFQDALAEQRERSRSGTKADLARTAELASRYNGLLGRTAPTEFLGYETLAAEGRVVAILRDGVEYETLEAVPEVELRTEAAARAELVLDRTPFYAESGGQVADTGRIRAADGSVLFDVDDVQRVAGTQTAGLTVHRGVLHGAVRVGDVVRAEVDAERRAHTMRNHTGTHLLHRALRNVVGDRARQAGSLVHPDYLRFDFPFDRALTDDEKRAIEAEVRRVVREDRPVVDRVDDDGRGAGRRRRRVLRREVRRQGAHDPRRRVQPRAVRRHPLPRVGADRHVRDHRRAEHRLRACAGSRPSPARRPTG